MHLQLARELNRIMGRDVTTEMKDTWLKIVPKVIAIAEEEKDDNMYMRNFLACYNFNEKMTTGIKCDTSAYVVIYICLYLVL